MINLRMPAEDDSLQPRITVIGVGGAGGNAVNNMILSNLEGVEFLVCNTDAQALKGSSADRRLQLGLNMTKGLGAGASPEKGRAAAEEAIEEIISYLEGSNMVFITAGMGGGTGTGAAPVIARAAREQDILTVGVVTKPFHFEGAHRMRLAEEGIKELQQYVDTLIVIPNQNLFRVANQKTTFAEAFKMADDVLHSGVRGVTDLMVMPGLINLDFADIRAVMSEMGKAMMGTGEGEGEQRATAAADAAISNPLLDDVSLKGARAMLINITGGMDISLFEVDEAVNRVRAEVDPDANVIFGSTFDPNMEGRMRVSVVATGIDAAQMRANTTNGQATAGQGNGVMMPRRPMIAMPPSRPTFPTPAAPVPTVQPTESRQVEQPLPPQQQYEAPQQATEMSYQPAPVETQPAPQMQQPVQQQQAPQQAPAPQPTMRTQAEWNETAFIAPKPVTPGQRPQNSTYQQQAMPQPMREEPAHEARRPNLFERMIGPRRHEDEPQQAPQQPTRTIASTAANPPVQTNLAIDPSRPVAHPSDEETLDIPAFLRRQAN
jgi:cell division protein FtsZ